MKNILIAIAVLTIISAGCSKQNIPTGNTLPSSAPQYNYTHQLKIDGQTLMVEVATTPAQRQQGLSDRSEMADNQGMLFDFGSNPSSTPFWMKDMKFDLDFIWITDGKVVGITANAFASQLPDNNLPLYYPPEPINQILEVNAGWAKKNNIAVGDDAQLIK